MNLGFNFGNGFCKGCLILYIAAAWPPARIVWAKAVNLPSLCTFAISKVVGGVAGGSAYVSQVGRLRLQVPGLFSTAEWQAQNPEYNVTVNVHRDLGNLK